MKDGDYIEHLFVCSSHDYLLFFSNRGKVYRSKVYELPEASRTAKGRALVNVLPLREGERIQSVLSTRDFTEAQVPRLRDAATAPSRRPSSSPTTRRSRPTASSRSTSATTTSSSPCARVDPGDEILMVSREGLAVRFEEDGRARDGPRHRRRARHERRRQGQRRCWPWTSRATTRRCSSSPRTASASARRSASTARPRAAPRACRRSSSPRSAAALAAALVVRPHQELRLHLPGGHGPAHRRARHPPDRPRGAGRDA